jgi:hypothetical protein
MPVHALVWTAKGAADQQDSELAPRHVAASASASASGQASHGVAQYRQEYIIGRNGGAIGHLEQIF